MKTRTFYAALLAAASITAITSCHAQQAQHAIPVTLGYAAKPVPKAPTEYAQKHVGWNEYTNQFGLSVWEYANTDGSTCGFVSYVPAMNRWIVSWSDIRTQGAETLLDDAKAMLLSRKACK